MGVVGEWARREQSISSFSLPPHSVSLCILFIVLLLHYAHYAHYAH